MAHHTDKEINVAELLRKIQSEAKKRKWDVPRFHHADLHGLPFPGSNAAGHGGRETTIWRTVKKIQAGLQKFAIYGIVYRIAVKFKKIVPHYEAQSVLADFLKYHDEEFIKQAYKGIVKRDADPHGLNNFLTKLRNGQLTKVEILGRLRYSREGKENKVKVKGLLTRYAVHSLYRVPVIGYLLNLVAAVMMLPRTQRNIRQNEAEVNARFTQQAEQNKRFADTDHRIASDVHVISMDLKNKAENQAVLDLGRQMDDHKNNIAELQSSIHRFMTEMHAKLSGSLSSAQMKDIAAEQDHLLDAMYVAFEDKFRGSRNDIKDRLKVYLPYIEQANAGSKSAPVLDLGCGRGEFLELIKENGMHGYGVDQNRVMLRQCREQGFEVVEGDVLDHLMAAGSQSVGAITGIHIVEHLSFKQIIQLFDEVYRTLLPGGVLILETPNPENLMVGACNFYVDPTHQRPLPPITVQFIAETRGFVRVDVKRLTEHRIEEAPPGVDRLTRQAYYTAPDYALIAYKA